MNTFLVCATRWMLASFWIFGALQQSESEILCDGPENPKIVVFGINSSEVSLNWKNCRPGVGETIFSYTFKRKGPDSGAKETLIASRLASEGGFSMEEPFNDGKKYVARYSQELIIRNVQKDEEYVYTLEISYQRPSGGLPQNSFEVTVDVKVPPKIIKAPTREDELNLDSVKNHTLKCNASGDPHPHITWTKDGVPASQFNASGYELHLVDVKREDAGSYICTASNGFGNSTTAIGIVNIRCTDCKTERVGIRIQGLSFKQLYRDQESSDFEDLESSLLSAIWGAYADNPGKQLHRVDVDEFRSGSVFAVVELAFASSVSDPLKPLRDEISDGKLGPYTVDRQLLSPTDPPITESTETATEDGKESPSTGARGSSSLSTSELWGIIGGCIAFVIVVAIIILVCCICRKKSKNSGASKGGKSYSEADGYRMNRQPPPSGLGTASPAYVEARQYAPVTAARRQDDQSKPPLNYADLSLNNSSGPGRKPPPYSGTEYSEMSPEKRPPPAGGQQGEGGGFELWC